MSTYCERLAASISWWIGALALGVAIGWIVLVPTSWTAGITTTVVITLTLGLVLWGATLVVSVDATGLAAGRATLGSTFIGEPEVLDSTAYHRRLGTGADARAFLATRPWIDRGVLVPVTDPADPAPYWIVGSRDPRRLAAAIVQIREYGIERQ